MQTLMSNYLTQVLSVLLMALFAFLWANDTGAYIFGVTLQRYIRCIKTCTALKS